MIDIFTQNNYEQDLNRSIDLIQSIKNPYIGSKRKILYSIYKNIIQNDIKHEKVIDLFSGGSSVGMMFKSMGKQVFSNDILYSSYSYAKTFVENNNVIISEIQKKQLLEDFENKNNIFEKYFDYYEKEQAYEIQKFLHNAQKYKGTIKYEICIANLILYLTERSVVGQLNSGQVVSKKQFRKNHHMNKGRTLQAKNIHFYNFNNINYNYNCKAYNLDVFEFLDLNIEADLIYIDPPYGGLQSDYIKMYNIIQDISNNLQEKNLDNGKRFSSKKQYKQNFQNLLEKVKKYKTLAISYNESSWQNIQTVKQIVEKFKKDIKVIDIEYQYRRRKERTGTEYLILAK